MPVSRMPRVTFAKRSLRSLLALGLFLAPAPALAYPTFPGAMQEQFDLKCPPSCLLCHTRIEGGKQFVKADDTSFVQNLVFIGQQTDLPIRNDDAEQFKKLLERYATEPCAAGAPPCDSDADGRSDVVELRNNEDPERVGDALPDCVQYGCGAHIAPKASTNVSGSSAGAVCALLGALVVFGRRARRRSRA
jgi:hypothetical protein